jgi:hypothetical protein
MKLDSGSFITLSDWRLHTPNRLSFRFTPTLKWQNFREVQHFFEILYLLRLKKLLAAQVNYTSKQINL